MSQEVRKIFKILCLVILYAAGISIIGAMIGRVSVKEFINIVKSVNVKTIVLALLFFVASIILRGTKLFIFYKIHYKGVKYLQLITVHLASNALNNMIPGRSGDFFTIYILRKRQNLSLNRMGSVLVIDKIVETSLMAVFLSGAVLYLIIKGNVQEINAILYTLLALLLLIMAAIIFLLISPKLVRSVLNCKVFRFIPQIIRNKIISFVDRLIDSCGMIGASGRLFQIACMTVVCWLLDFMALFTGINSITPVMILHSITAQAISIPISVLSFIPNGLGISSLSYVGVTGLLGYGAETVMIASVFIKVLFLLVIFLFGAIGAWGIRLVVRHNVL